MSANNIVYIKENKTKKEFPNEVWYQGCVENDGLGSLEKSFKTLEGACKYAEKLCEEFEVEYGIRFFFKGKSNK